MLREMVWLSKESSGIYLSYGTLKPLNIVTILLKSLIECPFMHISQNLHSSKSEEMILCEMWKSILEFSVELHMVVSTHDEVPLLPGLTGNDPPEHPK